MCTRIHDARVHVKCRTTSVLASKVRVPRRHALMLTCVVAKNGDHLMHTEGVDMSRLVRNSGVCVRIIVGEPF